MVGLPATGKTTFLAALWHILRSDEVNAALRLADVRGDREYLNRIADQWCACEPLERTPVRGETVVIRVVHPTSCEATELWIPDMSGETFENQWEAREASIEFARQAEEAAGVMLFLHPDVTQETDSIAEANRALAAWAGPDAVTMSSHADGAPPRPQAWHPRSVPTQVKVVELLQFLLAHQPHGCRVAVVVSAWDRAGKVASAEAWLTQRMSLLDQFLRANADRFSVRCYGVSAQGGNIKTDAEGLLVKSVPAERITVVGPNAGPHDITAPVKWLMGV
jgi:hypothetical protein